MSQEMQAERTGFWSRQFRGQPNINQILFDVVFGIVAPVLCFVFDPIAFRGDMMGTPLFAEYQTFTYLFSGFEILILALWLIWGARLRFLNYFVSGALIAGAIFCTILGCLLIPYSVLGLVVAIGILGFTPFLTAFVYFRNGYRAVLKHGELAGYTGQVGNLLLGCLLAFAGPFALATGINRVISDSVEQILHGDAQQASIAARRVRPLSFLSSAQFDRIVDEYMNDSDIPRKERLKKSYKEATGEDLETKRAILMD